MKDKSINRLVENNRKNQKTQKNELNKSKNQNKINKVSTNFSNENNIINNSNKNNLKDSLDQLPKDNLTNNKKNKNFENIYENIQRYSNISKINRRLFNSRDKVLKGNSFLNKVKSKKELVINNMKQKLFFNDKENENINIDNEGNLKKIIYKKNNISKNNINNKSLKKKSKKENVIKNFIKIEELNEILSSDNENLDTQSPRIINIESNSENTSKLEEKEIISNTLTIKDELVNYESDNDTNREKNVHQNSINFNNELALILDKHLTQIDFNKNLKNANEKKLSSHSPPLNRAPNQDKNSQMLSSNLNTIDQIKENTFSIYNLNNNQNDIPTSSAKINKINKNIIRKSHHIMKDKKELMLINYLKQNFFKKEENNNNSKYSENKNDIKNFESNEGNKYGTKNNINNMRKKSINKFNEELKINIDFDNIEKNKKIKYKEYKNKNNSITNGIIDVIKEIKNNNNIKIDLNSFSNLNSTLNKINKNSNNNSNEKYYVNIFNNGNFNENVPFIKNNKNSISIENDKNFNNKLPKKLYRNNSQNNDVKKNESIISLESNKNDNENSKHIYQIKINNLNLNNLNRNPKRNKETKAVNIKIENIEINNNKLRKNIPSPQHRNKEKTNIIKKTKISPENNNYKLNSSNKFFNISNNIYKNNNENINNNIQNNNINDKEKMKSNSNNFIECISSSNNNNFSLTCKEKSVEEFLRKDNPNMNKLPSKKIIKCINKNINPQKYKGNYKINQKKSNMNENSNMSNTNNNCNPSTSNTNNNNSEICLEENYKNNNKSPKLSKNNINTNNSANKFIILNKNKRNIHNSNNNNNDEIANNSINNYVNSNSYSTADKNSFIHITNSNVTKMKNKMNNNCNKGISQNYTIYPKNLFSSNNNIKSMINNRNNNVIQKNEKRNSNNNSSKKINNSNSNKNIYNDININNNNLSKNISSDKKVNIYSYNNVNNDEINDKKFDNMYINKSPEIIKKSSTTMKNKNNNINTQINPNNRYSINGNQVNSPLINNTKNIITNCNNLKKNENKKVNKVNNKVLKKNNNNNQIHRAGNKNNFIQDDIFMDGQIPSVADENPNVNSLKIMKYNKCTYTNQIISQKLNKIFCIKSLRNKILIFLNGNDLYNLSLVNHFYNDNTTFAVHKKIIRKILSHKEKTIKRIWKEMITKSPIYNNNNISLNEIYLNYLKDSDHYDEEITKDLSRTLPNNLLFKKESNNYKKLFNVLKAYSNYNKKIGYGQGMNFIVAKLIIFYGSEKQSFFYLDALFTKLNFSEVVGISNGLEQKMFVIQFLLNKFCPNVVKYLEEKKIKHEIFTVSWLITLFSKNFENNKLLLCIWNFSIIFGWKFIYLFTVSIIFNFEKKYLKLDLYEFTQYMKKIFKSKDFEENFNLLIQKTFEYMIQWKKIEKELKKYLEVYKMKIDTESGTEIIMDSFDEDTIIQ